MVGLCGALADRECPEFRVMPAFPIGEECVRRRMAGPPVENQLVVPPLVDDPEMNVGFVGARAGWCHGFFSGVPTLGGWRARLLPLLRPRLVLRWA